MTTRYNHLNESFLEYDDMKTVSENKKRIYVTPKGGRFVSITTMLGYLSRDKLDSWRAAVGVEEANRVSRIAAGRGTQVHSIIENYINNEEVNEQKLMPHIKANFNSIKPLLHNINNVYYQEVALYSNVLRLAGRVDCIAEYNGVLSIIDFKTAAKPKRQEWIDDYFIQCTFYACAFFELTGIEIKQVVVLIAVDGNPPQEFVQPVGNWLKKLIQARKKYDTEMLFRG